MITDFFDDTVQMMVNSLNDEAKQHDVNLRGLTYDNFNTFLDDTFGDGGYARCECFGDIAMEYALQFGEVDSTAFAIAQHDCIKAAIEKIAEQWKDAHYRWECPHEWLTEVIGDYTRKMLESVLLDIARDLDHDTLQGYFEHQMDKDGYFDLVLE